MRGGGAFYDVNDPGITGGLANLLGENTHRMEDLS
jgi:hypothetical protein